MRESFPRAWVFVGLSKDFEAGRVHDLELADSPIGISILCPGKVRTTLDAADRLRPEELSDAGGTSKVLGDLSDAGRGDHAALTRALIGLRRVGLEDIARRAALQHLILQADL